MRSSRLRYGELVSSAWTCECAPIKPPPLPMYTNPARLLLTSGCKVRTRPDSC